jgi:hypothetical protein
MPQVENFSGFRVPTDTRRFRTVAWFLLGRADYRRSDIINKEDVHD